ncbi:MAG: MraY family glycosyltransferase [Bacteroidetes bacterium]|nr:MraY family glycosyltransferase [Bacteroidota bacterium]
MTSLMLPATLAFLVVLFGMPSLIMVAKRKHLVDEPSESRKLHHRSVPTVGGVMLFAATICSALVSFAFSDAFGWTSVRWLGVLGASIPVFFMGLKDDIMGMAAVKKLMVHLAVGGFLVFGLDLRIDNFDGIFGLHELPGWVSTSFSLFVYVVIVNAINLIDGIDGLAGGYGLVAMSAFGMWAHWTGDVTSSIVAAAMVGGLAGFLVFNLNPAKIFMGDSGSLLLGYMCYVMAVSVVQTPDANTLSGVVRPIAAMCFLAYPLVDTLRVFTIRVLLGRSPFSPDRRHIHHLLMKLGWGHRLSSSALWMYTLLFVVLALQPNAFWAGLSVTEQFLVLLGLAFAVASVPYFLVRTGVGQSSLSQEGVEEKNDESNAPQGPRRVA